MCTKDMCVYMFCIPSMGIVCRYTCRYRAYDQPQSPVSCSQNGSEVQVDENLLKGGGRAASRAEGLLGFK